MGLFVLRIENEYSQSFKYTIGVEFVQLDIGLCTLIIQFAQLGPIGKFRELRKVEGLFLLKVVALPIACFGQGPRFLGLLDTNSDSTPAVGLSLNAPQGREAV